MSNSRLDEINQEIDRREAIEAEISKRESQSQQQPEEPYKRNVEDVVRDLGAGVARGSQNLASGLLEGGEYLTRKGAEKLGNSLGHPVKVPYWNAREFMGLEGKNPIDLGGMIQGKHPDALSQAVGQFGLPAGIGGANMLRQAATQGAYAASQASPNEKNAFGLLPSGRPGAAIEGVALGALPFAFPKILGVAKNALNDLFGAEKTTKNFLKDLSSGKSITDNMKDLSQRLREGQNTAKEAALIPKREVMAESGDERIFPSQVKGKEVTNKTASIFSDHPDNITPDKIAQHEKALKQYYKDGDIDALIEKGEDTFNHPGLSEKDIAALDQALIPEKAVKGEYLKIKNAEEHYSDLIQEAHDAYSKNPTFRNSDVLRSRLFKRINELNKEKKRVGALSDNKDRELAALTKSRSAIIKDQDNLIKTFSPENKGKYGKFNQTWREDVRAYEEAGSTIKNLKNGYLQTITPAKITNAFAFPELKPELQRILKHIGPEGVNNIVFNELGRTTNAKAAIRLIENLERNKGFSSYITPEIRNFYNTAKRQLRNKNMLKVGSGIAGAGALYETGKNALIPRI
jgi:hypothetical protein